MGRPGNKPNPTWRCPCGQLYSLALSRWGAPLFYVDGAANYARKRCLRCNRDLRRTRATIGRRGQQIALFAIVLAFFAIAAGLSATSSHAATFPCLNSNEPMLVASTDVAVSIGDCLGGSPDPSYQGGHHIGGIGSPMQEAVNAAIQACCDLVVNNVGWFIGIFLFFLSLRFGGAVLSWFRHRNAPKQMELF
jgi:hypothetical protein